MDIVLLVLSIIFLSYIAYQDFTERAIFWFLPIGLFVVQFYSSFDYFCFYDQWFSLWFNLAFIVIQFLGVFVFLSARRKKLVHLVGVYIGAGDVLFAMSTVASYSAVNFILYNVVSTCFSLIVVLLYWLFLNKKMTTVPYAGLFSVVMVLWLILELLGVTINRFDDFMLIKYFTY